VLEVEAEDSRQEDEDEGGVGAASMGRPTSIRIHSIKIPLLQLLHPPVSTNILMPVEGVEIMAGVEGVEEDRTHGVCVSPNYGIGCAK
jgi:hypothetical protein